MPLLSYPVAGKPPSNNDLDTPIVFDYLVRQLIAQMTDKKKTKGK
ncbi:MAG: hypothetical protein U9N82_01920 [Thermodesulfobacteriota bacterium]|nr:hypothetical protein [Thermodesulfobacteriota bacterium]